MSAQCLVTWLDDLWMPPERNIDRFCGLRPARRDVLFLIDEGRRHVEADRQRSIQNNSGLPQGRADSSAAG
jgi:hypothetical protein